MLTKEDAIPILLSRKVEFTRPQLWKLSQERLNEILGPQVTISELQMISNLQLRRSPYLVYTMKDLRILATQNGIPHSGITKGGLIDILLDTQPAPPIVLDPDQQAIINDWNSEEQIIVAGPGTGKTTTACALAARILREQPEARIAILAFNRIAQSTLESRLKLVGVKPISKGQLRSGDPGCYVLTFDKYVYHSRQPDVTSGSYRMAFEEALTIEPKEHERWDWLIIDEAQDVTPNHSRLIDQLQSLAKHRFYIGDPRQELYPGAEWFSQLCSSRNTKSLRYNHRSSQRVVEFLNRYSREHFPTLHYDQIPVRSEIGNIDFEITSTPGTTLGNLITKESPGNIYGITPITVSKFNNDSVIGSIRQTIHEIHPGSYTTIMDTDTSGLTPGSYLIGTSRKLKGTERKTVIVFQVDLPYLEYGVTSASLLKAIFVAISRGQDNVKIILSRSPAPGDIFFNLVPSDIPLSSTPNIVAGPQINRVRVWDDLVKTCTGCWSIVSKDLYDHDPIQITSHLDPDFLGVYLETCVASSAGIPNKEIVSFRKRTDEELSGVFHLRDNKFEALSESQSQSNELFDLYSQLKIENSEYAFTLVKFSSQIGKIWTLSERLKDIDHLEFGIYGQIVKSWLDSECQSVSHGKKLVVPIVLHRSQKNVKVGNIVGEVDFASSKGVVEMKHADPDIKHLIQIGLYATLSGLKFGLLMNTKIGKTTVVRSFDLDYTLNVARSFLALKHAQIYGNRLPYRHPRQCQTEVIISVDIEEEDGCITEIGAWAIGSGLEQIYGVYHDINRGVIPGNISLIGSMTGLQIVNKEQARLDPIVDRFWNWVQGLSSVRTFFFWSGSEQTKLRLFGNPSVDVQHLFKVWLEQIGQSRPSGLTLSDAVLQTLGPTIPFVPHRAFEDAVLTGCVYIAISQIGGSV